MFGVPELSAVLEQVAARYGIDVRLEHEVVEVNPAARELSVVNRKAGGEEKSALPYDMAHLVPPQSAPAWIKSGPPAGPASAGGYVQIDKTTMQHTRHPTFSAWATPAPPRTRRPGRPSASRLRWW